MCDWCAGSCHCAALDVSTNWYIINNIVALPSFSRTNLTRNWMDIIDLLFPTAPPRLQDKVTL